MRGHRTTPYPRITRIRILVYKYAYGLVCIFAIRSHSHALCDIVLHNKRDVRVQAPAHKLASRQIIIKISMKVVESRLRNNGKLNHQHRLFLFCKSLERNNSRTLIICQNSTAGVLKQPTLARFSPNRTQLDDIFSKAKILADELYSEQLQKGSPEKIRLRRNSTRDFAFCVTMTTEKISWIMSYGCLLEIFLTEQSLIISDR